MQKTLPRNIQSAMLPLGFLTFNNQIISQERDQHCNKLSLIKTQVNKQSQCFLTNLLLTKLIHPTRWAHLPNLRVAKMTLLIA